VSEEREEKVEKCCHTKKEAKRSKEEIEILN